MEISGIVSENGWFALDYPHNVVALLDADGNYTILYDESNNDGMDFWGGRTPEEALLDWYLKAYNLTDTYPPYVVEWIEPDHGTFARRYDGEGWSIYIPISTWIPSGTAR